MVAADGVGEYPVVGESRAGQLDDVPVRPGTVMYITTGTSEGKRNRIAPIAVSREQSRESAPF